LDKPIGRRHLEDLELDKINILKERLNILKEGGLGSYISK
jgi:hypothetical protein